MLLFRRLRKDKEEPPAGEGKSAEVAPAPSPPSVPKVESNRAKGPASAGPPSPVSPPAPVAPPPAPVPPPRLPEKPPAEAARPRVERGPFGVCFVCGSVLEGRMCPACRIAWVE